MFLRGLALAGNCSGRRLRPDSAQCVLSPLKQKFSLTEQLHGRCHGLGMDALANGRVSSMDFIMIWAWMTSQSERKWGKRGSSTQDCSSQIVHVLLRLQAEYSSELAEPFFAMANWPCQCPTSQRDPEREREARFGGSTGTDRRLAQCARKYHTDPCAHARVRARGCAPSFV